MQAQSVCTWLRDGGVEGGVVTEVLCATHHNHDMVVGHSDLSSVHEGGVGDQMGPWADACGENTTS